MTMEQVISQLMNHTDEIASLRESSKSAQRRMDESERITDGIHKLASNVETLALQVKHLTDRFDRNIERLETSLRSQGERIGELENEPAKKWKALAGQVMGIIVAALVGGVLARFLS